MRAKTENATREAKQGGSADTNGGWLNHYNRMLRWGERVKAHSRYPVGGPGLDAVDFALAYFVWAHSLREWLIECKAAEKKALDSILQTKPDWKILRDLANRSRHYELTMSPTDRDWSLTRRIANPFVQRASTEEEWVISFGRQTEKDLYVDGEIRHTGYFYEDENGDQAEFEVVTLSEMVERITRMWDETLQFLSIHPSASPDTQFWTRPFR